MNDSRQQLRMYLSVFSEFRISSHIDLSMPFVISWWFGIIVHLLSVKPFFESTAQGFYELDYFYAFLE